MKYKYLSEEQIIISLDRLTRFKNPKEKYLRVFTDILRTCLIEPQLRKTEIEKMDFAKLTTLAETILNNSIEKLCKSDLNKKINLIIKEFENNAFKNDIETQKLLDNNIAYNIAAKLILENSPVNLLWLKTLCEDSETDIKELRESKHLKYPVEKLVLAEGITEEILLPAFSKYLNYDFYQKGIHIIAAGGKNQVVKMYYKLIEEVKLPIFVLLDKDAEENIQQIMPKLREIDKIHLVASGEFEDLLPKSLIVKTVNNHFENFLSISEQDLVSEFPTAKVLEELFRIKGLHEFKKAEFAKLIRDNINSDSDISNEIRNIVDELFE